MSHANRSVYAAIAGDLAVATLKFTAATLFGSSAMLTEAFHSVTDIGNDALLLLGRHRSNRPPDVEHPLGHGQELYFWSFVVAILVFAVGAGFSLYEGISRILHPHPLQHSSWNYGVLLLAALFESVSLAIGYRQFRQNARGRSSWMLLRESKDPPVFSVVLEDTAALIGIVLAFAGVWLSTRFGNPIFDNVASIGIGCVLTLVSLILIRESRGLLLGEAMGAEATENICRLARGSRGVVAVSRPLTLYFGPDVILLAMDVEFASNLTSDDVIRAVDDIEESIRREYPKVARIYIEAEALSGKTSPGGVARSLPQK